MPLSPEDRKAELARRRVKQSAIAAALHVTATSVSNVVRGTKRSARIEAAIADAIGRSREDVFPPATRERSAA